MQPSESQHFFGGPDTPPFCPVPLLAPAHLPFVFVGGRLPRRSPSRWLSQRTALPTDCDSAHLTHTNKAMGPAAGQRARGGGRGREQKESCDSEGCMIRT